MPRLKKLLENFIPSHYDLAIDLSNTNQLNFKGMVIISGTSTKKAKMITLHAKNLKIHYINVDRIEINNWQLLDDELVINHVTNANQKLLIEIGYSGLISDTMHGLYQSSYIYNNKAHFIYATQLESHHARKVFPCIDEPSAKAVFDLKVISEPGKTVLSNMPCLRQTESKSKQITQFNSSLKMSTYLLALAVGEFNKVTVKTNSEITISAYSALNINHTGLVFALETAKASLEFYEKYFNVAYPLPKLDNVALPDFSAGAMENWGLICYRESHIIADKRATLKHKKKIAKTIAHEIAHQWFGNLVTMMWWDDLWLNESFATYMEYVCIDNIYPEMKIWDDFIVGESYYALKRDCYQYVQSVRIDVKHPSEIPTLFDPAIVYAKGSRLIKMLSSLVGEDNFRLALSEYFNDNCYNNSQADDLWRAITRHSSVDIENLMHSWLNQPGYPVITVQLNNNYLKLSQQQFLLTLNKPKSHDYWQIPIDSSIPSLPTIFDKPGEQYEYKPDSEHLIILNQSNSSHFVTNYLDELFDRLIMSIQHGRINDAMIAQLICEQGLLFKASLVDVGHIISLIQAGSKSKKLIVWQAINIVIGDLQAICYSDGQLLNKLRHLCDDISDDLYDIFGLCPAKSEEPQTTQLREIILRLKLFAKNRRFIDQSIAIFDNNSKHTSLINPEIRSIVFKTVILHHRDKKEIFKIFIQMYPCESDPEIKHDLLHAICASTDSKNINLLLKLLTDQSFIRHQDVLSAYVGLLKNKHATDYAWQWLQLNWMWVYKRVASDESASSYVRYTADLLYTSNQLKHFRLFFQPMKKIINIKRSITIGIDELKYRVKRINKITPSVKSCLNDLYPGI